MSGEQPPRRARAYELMPETHYQTAQPPPGDPLEDEIRAQDEETARRLRASRVDAMIAENDQRSRKARGISLEDETGIHQISPGGRREMFYQPPVASPAASIVSSLMAGGMSPEKAQEFIRGLAPEDIAKMNMFAASRPGGGGTDPAMAMMLLGRLGSNNQITVKDLIEIGPKYVESARAMAEISRPSNSGGNDISGVLIEMVKEMGKDRTAGMQAQIDTLKESMKGSDPVGSVTGIIKSLKESGLVPDRGSDSKPEIDLKIEEMRTDREMKLLQMRMDMNKQVMAQQSESERWQGILTALPSMFAMFAKPIEEGVRAAARKTAGVANAVQTPSQPSVPAPVAQQTVQAVKLVCGDCQNEFVVQEPFPAQIVCTKCGHTAEMPKL